MERGEKGDHGQDSPLIDFQIFMAETVVYRKEQKERMDRLSVKIDKVFDKLDLLPCKERSYMPTQINAIWGFIGAIIIAIIVQWIRK
jgi:hypothetical protein